MTTDEHMMMFMLFFKQRQSIRVLLDMLKSRGVLSGDDESAFAFAHVQDQALNAAIFDEALEAYQTLAEATGIQTGLDKLSKPPEEWFRPPTGN